MEGSAQSGLFAQVARGGGQCIQRGQPGLHDFARFFLAPDLAMLQALIGACSAAGEPGIARVTAETACGKQLGAEILLTPLKVDATLGDRYLGLFQSLGGEAFLDERPIRFMRLGSIHPPMAKAPKGMRLVVVND